MASLDTGVSYHYGKETLLSEHDLLLARIKMNARSNTLVARRFVQLQVGKISEISKLQSIKICDLSPNTENKNTFLYAWLISEVAIAETIRFIVGDEYSNFCRVSMPGNVDTSGLVIGLAIVFCHPFYEMASDGKYSIIFHSISDIFLLTRSPTIPISPEQDKNELRKLSINLDCSSRLDSSLINESKATREEAGETEQLSQINSPLTELTYNKPKENTRQEKTQLLPPGPEKDASEFSEIGSILYREGRYLQAMVQYTCAIQANGRDAVFYSNRSLCYSKLCQYEDALSDIQKANSLDPDCIKYQYLIALTWSRFGHHRLSLDLLRRIKPKDSIDCESVDRLIDKEKVLVEHMEGKFDFNKIRENYMASGCQPIEIGDFIGPVQIQHSTDNGTRSMVTTRKVRRGENIFVVQAAKQMNLGTAECSCIDCRGFTFGVFSRDTSLHRSLIEDTVKSKHTTVKLITLCDESMKNVNINIYSGSGYEFTKNFDTTKHPLSKLRSLIMKNLLLEMDRTFFPQALIPKCAGIWLLPHFINHSCIPNTVNLYIGNICIVRAITDIPEGEEVTTCRFPLVFFPNIRTRNCKNVCKLCSFETRPAVDHINEQLFTVVCTLGEYGEPQCMLAQRVKSINQKCKELPREKWLELQTTLLKLVRELKSLQTYEIVSALFQVAVLKMIMTSSNASDALALCLKAEPYFSQLEPETFTKFWHLFLGCVRADNKLKDDRFKHVEGKYKEVMNLFS